jgi:tetratricopeptide (TPR) repeat protein
MDIQAIIKKGELLFQQGKLQEAEEQFLSIIEYDYENKAAHNNLGVIAFSEMEHEKAISHFKKAIDIDPVYMDAIINLCDVLQSTNSLATALPIIEKALELNPENTVLRKILKEDDSNNIIDQANTTAGSINHFQNDTGDPQGYLQRQRSIKVIHLPLIIANNAIALSKYLNRLGVESKVISYFRTWLNYQGDINLDLDGLNVADKNRKVKEFVDDFFANEAYKYDIFHFHFFDSLSTGTSFGGWKSHPERGDLWDLERIKEMGKRIVVSSWGSDVRNNSKLVYYQLQYEDPSMELPYPPLNRKDQYGKIWKFAQYADAMVHADYETINHTPYGMMIPIGIDLEPFDLLLKDHPRHPERTSILYAPSNQFYKGTAYAEAVLKRISSRYGEGIEIRKVHGLPHEEAIRRYVGQGAAIDDIAIFSFGLFALEAMYLGRTVFTTLRKEEYFGDDMKLMAPIVSVHSEEDFYNKMVSFIETDRRDPIDSYQAFIHERCSSSVIARQYQGLYERLMAGERIDQHVSQVWNREFQSFLTGQKIDVRDYYPQVTDILLKRRDYGKLMHEVQMGMGLNNDIDLIAKYIFALEATDQVEQAVVLRRNNAAVVCTAAFMEAYQRARELVHTVHNG